MKFPKLQLESEGLVGRDSEIHKLRVVLSSSGSSSADQDAPRSARGEADLALVYGYSGSGKSTVISEALNIGLDQEEEEGSPLVHGTIRRSYLVGNGKFDQYEGKDMPYVGLVDAIQDIYKSVLQDYREETEKLQTELQQELDGFQLKHLIDVVPLVASIVKSTRQNGEASSLNTISAENQESIDQFSPHHLNSSLRTLFRVMLRTVSNRIVLVVEDLQWADVGSLELIEALVTDANLIGLVVVGSYRDNEVDEFHPLHQWLKSIASQKVPERLTSISVSNLELQDLNEFIAGVLQRHRNEDTLPLSRVIHRKTHGNPFYSKVLLRQLVRDKALFFSMKDFRWSWDIDKVESCAGISDNVVDLVVQKMEHLPSDTMRALQIASYLGSRFDAGVIDSILLESMDNHHERAQQGDLEGSNGGKERLRRGSAALKEAVEEDLLVKREENNRFRFAHDKIQQAAFSMLAKHDEDSRLMHLQIGRHLKKRYDDGDLSSLLPAVVQLNQGSSLMTDMTERIKLANLNFCAAKLSKNRAALTSTVSFLRSGLALIPKQSLWSKYYNLTLPMQTLRCDMLCSLGDHIESNQIVDEILTNARCADDTFEPTLTRVNSLLYQDRLSESIDVGVRLLKVLGEKLPRKPGSLHIIWEFVRSETALKGRSCDEILRHLEIANKKKYLAKKVVQMISVAAAFSDDNNLSAVVNLRAMQISLKYGLSKYSAVGFATYGISLGMKGDFKDAYMLGALAQDLLTRFECKKSSSHARTIVHAFLNHLRRPLQESLEPMLTAYNDGMINGDVQVAGISCTSYCAIYVICGLPLGAIAKDLQSYSTEMKRYGSQFSLKLIGIWGQLVSNLRGHDPISSDDPFKLTGVFMNEELTIPKLNRGQKVNLYLAKLIVAYLLGNYELALEAIECDRKLTNESMDGTIYVVPAKCFFSAMTALQLERRLSRNDRKKRKYYRKLRRGYVRRLETWYANGVMNAHHFVLILHAEVAFAEGKVSHDDVRSLYEKSITASARSGCAYAHGIALERMGIFFRDALGDLDSASYFLKQAYERFTDWQSDAKLKQMRTEYHDLLLEWKECMEDAEEDVIVADEDGADSTMPTSSITDSMTESNSSSRRQQFIAASRSPVRVRESLTRPTTEVARLSVKGTERYDSTMVAKHFAEADEVAERLDTSMPGSFRRIMASSRYFSWRRESVGISISSTSL